MPNTTIWKMYIVIKMAITEINKIPLLFTIYYFLCKVMVQLKVLITTKLVYLYPILTLNVLLKSIKVKITHIKDNFI